MIHGVIFDFRNVIATFDNRKFTKALTSYNGKNEEELYHTISESEIPKLFEVGLIDSDEFYSSIIGLTHSNISKEEFLEIYVKDKFTPIQPTINILKSLRNDHFKIGLISNTNELDYEFGMRPIYLLGFIQ
jgi:FMN phosphatase YigB (HAD superfamily)